MELHALDLIRAFRTDVWGNETVFKSQIRQATCTVEYLDFGRHFDAVRLFCPAVQDQRLLITEEYRSAFVAFETDEEMHKRGACIMGQPGIGKSSFIAFAVIEQLRRGRPVAVEVSWKLSLQQSYLLFSENDVTLHEALDDIPLRCRPGIWAFSDSNELITIPTFAFLRTLGVRTFQSASPARHRWKQWTKENKVQLYLMEVWSDRDVEGLAFMLEFDVTLVTSLTRWAAKFGRIPRTLLRLCKGVVDEKRVESSVNDAIDSVVNCPGAVLGAVESLNNDLSFPESSSVFFLRPWMGKGGVHRGAASIYLPTRWITNQVSKALRHQSDGRIAEFFEMMSIHRVFRSSSGWLFERHLHAFLVQGNMIAIHYHGGDSDVETVTFRELQACSTFEEPRYRCPPFYWRLPTSNFQGIDSVLFTQNEAYIIHSTLSSDIEDLQSAINTIWDVLKLEEDKMGLNYKVLFIGPLESVCRGGLHSSFLAS